MCAWLYKIGQTRMEAQRHTFRVMGGEASLELRGSGVDLSAAAAAVAAEAHRIEQKFSRYLPDSIVSEINRSAGHGVVGIDEETGALLDYAAACFEQSDGLFDITSGVLRRVWNFHDKILPREEDIARILPLVGWEKVEWRRPHLRLPLKGMEIDFGGIGKEYAVDRCVGVARELGVEAGFVNFAGDLRIIGPNSSGDPYRIGLVDPRRVGEVFATVEVVSGALATSGDYERYFEIEGRRFCHILNPKTGWPVGDFQSVSVLSESCLIAGSASTIAMLLGSDRGAKFLKELGLPFILRDAAGSDLYHPQSLRRSGC